MGYVPVDAISAKHVAISHGHSDHIGCLPMHERLRHKIEMANYAMPSICFSPFKIMHFGLSALDVIFYGNDNYFKLHQSEDFIDDNYPINKR